MLICLKHINVRYRVTSEAAVDMSVIQYYAFSENVYIFTLTDKHLKSSLLEKIVSFYYAFHTEDWQSSINEVNSSIRN